MTSVAAPKAKRSIPGFAQMQRVGRSLMLPIAALPAAGILLRLGQADMLGKDGLSSHISWMQPVADVMAAAGNALFGNLAIIFAIGVAIGYARKSEGATALAGLVGYLVFSAVTTSLAPHFGGISDLDKAAIVSKVTDGYTGDPLALQTAIDAAVDAARTINYGVLGGIVIGVTAALLYDRYYRIKLPSYLGFFGGRRFVPIITAVTSMLIAVFFAIIYPAFNWLFTSIGNWVTDPGNSVIGGFVFGTANRLLVPVGLHHLLNSFPWFQFGSFTGADGVVYNGDIARFIHLDPTAGLFMTGFFPIFMFALPAAAMAIWHSAAPNRRKVVGGIMISAALTAFLTGITEPLEFSFLYVAYPLYAIHAVLTGSSLALVNALGIRDGFTFSAGGIDFALNWNIATNPAYLILIGLGYAVIYYVLFRWAIKKFNFKTPGREDEGAEDSGFSIIDQDMTPKASKKPAVPVGSAAPSDAAPPTGITT